VPEDLHLLRPPALRGSDPLGFLAAVGLIALAEEVPDVLGPLRLGWEGSRAPRALFETSAETVEQLVERATKAFERTRVEGRVIPRLDPDFPTRKVGIKGSDPMRLERPEVEQLRAEAFDHWIAGDPWLSRWVSALVAPAAVHEKGYWELTSLYAYAGQMTLRGLFDKAVSATEQVGGPRDALTAWRRLDGYQGANLDHRAVRTAEFATDGKPSDHGAPSPTWLALLATRLLPVTDDGRRARTTSWLPVRLYDGYTRRSLVWPIWERPLDAPAVRAVLALPPLNAESASREELERRLRSTAATLRGLGVRAVYGASRRTANRADGPLGPSTLLWSAV
jgi:hypothetical protein